MARFLPPYSKKHAMIFGSLTLFLGFALIFIIEYNYKPSNTATPIKVASSQELKEEHEAAFEKLEQDNAHGALVIDNVFIIDIRPQEEFRSSHITGAKNLNPVDLEEALLSEDLHIILYGQDSESLAKAEAALASHKVASIQVLKEDLNELEDQGYPLTTQP